MHACVREEELGLFGYIKASDDWMLKVFGETLQVRETKNKFKKWVEKARKGEVVAWEGYEGYQ